MTIDDKGSSLLRLSIARVENFFMDVGFQYWRGLLSVNGSAPRKSNPRRPQSREYGFHQRLSACLFVCLSVIFRTILLSQKPMPLGYQT